MCKLDLKLNLFSIYLKILNHCLEWYRIMMILFNIEINTIAFPKSELDEKLGDISQSTQRKYWHFLYLFTTFFMISCNLFNVSLTCNMRKGVYLIHFLFDFGYGLSHELSNLWRPYYHLFIYFESTTKIHKTKQDDTKKLLSWIFVTFGEKRG